MSRRRRRRRRGRRGNRRRAEEPDVENVTTDETREKLKEEKRKHAEKWVTDVFWLYSKDGVLPKEDFGTTIYTLDLNPTQGDIENMLSEFREGPTIELEDYMKLVTEIMITKEYKGSVLVRDSEDTILKAFKTLDEMSGEVSGIIRLNFLVEMLQKHGEPLSVDEVDKFKEASKDCEQQQLVKYEDFSALMAN